MEPRSTLRNTVGLLALGVSLALASPGVNVVRAEPSKPATQAAAPGSAECSAPAAVPANPTAEDVVVQLHREHETPSQKLPGRSDGDFVVLNTRGYNYGPQRGAGPAPAQQEEPGR